MESIFVHEAKQKENEMEKQVARVLKANNVKMQGSYHLGVDQSGQSSVANDKANTVGMISQARIIEKNEAFAVIEITCSCGKKTQVKCEFGK